MAYGWEERHYVLSGYNWQYFITRNKMSLTLGELKSTRKLKNSEQRILSSHFGSFVLWLLSSLLYLYLCVLFYSHSWLLFLQVHSTHEPVCLTWPSSDQKLINHLYVLFVSHTRDTLNSLAYLFWIRYYQFIIILAMITTNI